MNYQKIIALGINAIKIDFKNEQALHISKKKVTSQSQNKKVAINEMTQS